MARRFDDDPVLVVAAQGGDEAAFTTLFRRWFDPCFDVARRIVHNDDTAAEVAQETFLVAWRQIGTLRDPSAFGGWVLRTSRNKALNRLEKERRSVAVDQDESPVLAGLDSGVDVAADVATGAAVADQQQLVWAAAAALGERDASILDLHLRHGLDASEIAEALDVTTNNAHQLLFRMKGKLAGSIRAWVLFKGGDPQCAELGRVLRQSGAASFSAATVKTINTHVDGCDECSRRQAAVLAPEAMFAAVPLFPVGAVLRDRVAGALRTEGVPLGPEAAQPLSSSEVATAEADAPEQRAGDDSSAARGAPTEVVPIAAAGVDAGAEAADGEGGTRTKGLAAVGMVVALLLVIGGWLVLRGDDGEADVAGPPVATTAPTTEPRSGTSAPGPALDALAPVEPTTTTLAPAPPSSAPATILPPVIDPPPPSIPPPPPPPTPAPTPAPTITTFTATPAATPGGACPPGQWAFTLNWVTTDTTDVLLIDNSGLSEPLPGPPAGTAVGCGLTPGGTWTLLASGSGGQATRTE